jgi:hypothetical protein
MLTGLNVTARDESYEFSGRGTHKIDTRSIGGWKGYITMYANEGSASKERTTFCNMWLEKFVFCGKSAGPTTNCQKMAERIVLNDPMPLGKYLLGDVYRLLHQVSICLRRGKSIGNLGGPWWFIQLWLNAYMHRIVKIDLKNCRFPSSNFAETEEFVVTPGFSQNPDATICVPRMSTEHIWITNMALQRTQCSK